MFPTLDANHNPASGNVEVTPHGSVAATERPPASLSVQTSPFALTTSHDVAAGATRGQPEHSAGFACPVEKAADMHAEYFLCRTGCAKAQVTQVRTHVKNCHRPGLSFHRRCGKYFNNQAECAEHEVACRVWKRWRRTREANEEAWMELYDFLNPNTCRPSSPYNPSAPTIGDLPIPPGLAAPTPSTGSAFESQAIAPYQTMQDYVADECSEEAMDARGSKEDVDAKSEDDNKPSGNMIVKKDIKDEHEVEDNKEQPITTTNNSEEGMDPRVRDEGEDGDKVNDGTYRYQEQQ
ncbi:hypothetical protein CC80DRAFT_588218 [Byssothecium circinans]|uniref:Uncharacterized protein n=1 Tax=Byssothecium circinans TaxID=147558 RepID=A0A6A5UNN7_9PLEO|nr:hypothetical protein CC80DRAFT_588218 [Byssothecium circinans]